MEEGIVKKNNGRKNKKEEGIMSGIIFLLLGDEEDWKVAILFLDFKLEDFELLVVFKVFILEERTHLENQKGVLEKKPL